MARKYDRADVYLFWKENGASATKAHFGMGDTVLSMILQEYGVVRRKPQHTTCADCGRTFGALYRNLWGEMRHLMHVGKGLCKSCYTYKKSSVTYHRSRYMERSTVCNRCKCHMGFGGLERGTAELCRKCYTHEYGKKYRLLKKLQKYENGEKLKKSKPLDDDKVSLADIALGRTKVKNITLSKKAKWTDDNDNSPTGGLGWCNKCKQEVTNPNPHPEDFRPYKDYDDDETGVLGL